MKRILVILIFFLSGNAFAQQLILDSLIYSLTIKTIDDYSKGKINILKYPVIPSQLWDRESGEVSPGKFFKDSDAEFIKEQIQNPAVKTWDKGRFKEKQNIKLTKRIRRGLSFLGLHGKEHLIISLPIISNDLDTVVIFYESWDKSLFNRWSSGAGFVAIWTKNQNGEWEITKNDMLWITEKVEPAHNSSKIQLPVVLSGSARVIPNVLNLKTKLTPASAFCRAVGVH